MKTIYSNLYLILSLSVLFGNFRYLTAAEGADSTSGANHNPKKGKRLLCKNETALKTDFLNQLLRHEVYGNPNLIESPTLSEAAKGYQQRLSEKHKLLAGPNLEANLFKNLTKTKLFDGSTALNTSASRPQPGDVLLNMNFLNPDNIGTFYSKRGMIHARIVAASRATADGGELTLLDGGWQQFSKLSQVHSQTVWLRPKKDYFKEKEKDSLVHLTKLYEPVPYDNQLIDNLADYRKVLHTYIAQKITEAKSQNQKPNLKKIQEEAREIALTESKPKPDQSYKGFYPFGKAESAIPASGFYCSEAGSDIFSLSGFRLFGEIPFDLVVAFSPDGKIPSWAIYSEALTGFGADEGLAFMMHKLFFQYFSIMDEAWKKGILELPVGYEGPKDNFVAIAKQNRKNLLNVVSKNDPLKEQLQLVIQKTEGDSQFANFNKDAKKLDLELTKLIEKISQAQGTTHQEKLTRLIDQQFFVNEAYGPNHFLENGDYFELVGVFYNTDLEGGYQAEWVADSERGNESTTLYQIDESAPLSSEGACVMATGRGSTLSPLPTEL